MITSERKIGLDIIRSLAILMVVVCHSAEFLNRLAANPRIGEIIRCYYTAVQPLGLLGVELFFVLSGFLVGTILIRKFIEADRFSFGHVRSFWIRRWFRTLPLYWLILTANILLWYGMKLGHIEPYMFSYYFFLQNLWHPHPLFFFGEAWSLSIEEWFYLTLPVVLLSSALLFKPVNKKKFLFRVFLCYLSVFMLARFFNAFHPLYGPDQDMGIRKVVMFRLDAVMYGVLISWFNIYNSAVLHRFKNQFFIAGLAGSAFVWYQMSFTAAGITSPTDSSLKFLSDAFLYLVIPLFFSLCLPFAYHIRSLRSKLASRIFTHISRISYSMYLVHYSLVFIYFFCYLKLDSTGSILLLYLLYWVIVIALSSALYKYFEYPVMQLRDRFTARSKKQGE